MYIIFNNRYAIVKLKNQFQGIGSAQTEDNFFLSTSFWEMLKCLYFSNYIRGDMKGILGLITKRNLYELQFHSHLYKNSRMLRRYLHLIL